MGRNSLPAPLQARPGDRGCLRKDIAERGGTPASHYRAYQGPPLKEKPLLPVATSQGGLGVDEKTPKGSSWPDCLFVAQLPALFGGWRRGSQLEDESNQGPGWGLGSLAYNRLFWGSSHVLPYESRSCGLAGPHRPLLWRPASPVLLSVQGGGAGVCWANERLAREWALGSYTMSSFNQPMLGP